MNRREFLKCSLVLGAGALLPTSLLGAPSEDADPDHFLILYLISGGVDSHLWFDARSKKLTASNLKVCFLEGDDEKLMRPIVDRRGLRHYCTPLVEKLWKDHQDFFSILKGVYMSESFDGHDNNMTMLLTGKALASDSFVPEISTGHLLDFVQSGLALDFAQNLGGGASLSPTMMANLVRQARGGKFGPKTGDAFIRERYATIKASGLLGRGAARVLSGFERRAELAKLLSRARIEDYQAASPQTSDNVRFLPVMRDAFVNKLTRVALFRDGGIVALDAHSAGQCQSLSSTYPPIIQSLHGLFQYLKDTPYDRKRQLSEVCTVVVASEFNRTYRTLGLDDVTKSGTDHNQFSNFVLIGGKGIRSGLICGDTDLKEIDGKNQFVGVSDAHHQKDPTLIKAMGLPFDFARLMGVPYAPGASFKLENHLTYNSVINTVLSVFGKSRSVASIENTAKRAPTLDALRS